MPNDQSPDDLRSRMIGQLKSLGLNEEKAKELIDSESPFYNDFIIIDKLKSLSEGQAKLSRRSNWQSWLIILIATATLFLSVAVALHWL